MLKDKIFDYVKKFNYVSFAELSRIEGFNGNIAFGFESDKGSNIIAWLSEEAFKAIAELKKEKLIEFEACNPLIYAMDGMLPNLPTAKTVRHYKKTHWLPLTISRRQKWRNV